LFGGEGGKVGSRKRHNGTCQEQERGREIKRKKDRDTQEAERREEKGEEDWCKFGREEPFAAKQPYLSAANTL